MKLLKRIISLVIWTVIGLNLALVGLSHLPVAQRWLAVRVADAAAATLGTQVSMGRIDVGLFNRVIIDDALVLDQQGEPLLRVARLSAKIDLAALAEGRIALSSAQLFGAHARLYRADSLAQTNFQFIVDSLSSPDSTSRRPLDLRINSLIVRHSSVSYDERDLPATDQRLNPAHLAFSDISAHLNLRRLTDDSLSVAVKRLSMAEQSGLAIDRLSLRLEASQRHLRLRDFMLQMPSSQLQIDTLTADYRLHDGRITPGTLRLNLDILDSYVTPSDLRCFLPSLKNFQRPVYLSLSCQGTDEHLQIPTLRLATGAKDLQADLSGWAGLIQPSPVADIAAGPSPQPVGQLQIRQLALSESIIDFIVKSFGQLPRELLRIGQLSLSGTITRDERLLTTLTADVATDAGNATLAATINADRRFTADVSTPDVSLGRLLADERLDRLSATIHADGQLAADHQPDVSVEATVPLFSFGGYDYSNVSLRALYAGGNVSGDLQIADPNVAATLSGQFTLPDSTRRQHRHLALLGTVDHLSPSALGLTDRWRDGIFSGTIEADLAGTTLTDAVGSLRLSQLTLADADHLMPYQLDNLVVSADRQGPLRTVTLKSDFADATLHGDFDYATLPRSIARLVASRLPTLPNLPPDIHHTPAPGNNFSLRLLMTKADWLQRLLGIDLQLYQPLLLNARVNDHTDDILLQAQTADFAYGNLHFADADLLVNTRADSLACQLSLHRLMSQQRRMAATLRAAAADNELLASLAWDNHHDTGGQLNTTMQFYHNHRGTPEAHVRIRPSHVRLDGESWLVEPADIVYQSDRLLVDNVTIRHGQQHIIADGIASPDPADAITIDLSRVDVAYVLDLVGFDTVEFSGLASGQATLRTPFHQLRAEGDLRVDDFHFEQGRMGTLSAQVAWNELLQQIDIRAIADDAPSARTYINGYVSPTHNTIDLAIRADSTYIDFLQNFTSSFLSGVTGHAKGDVRLAGTLDNINLTGQLAVSGQATVSALNTTYYLAHDTITLVPDDIRLDRLPLHDAEGHEAWLSGGIHHRHLTHLTFDLGVDADNLLAYDFREFGDNTFCGTVYASGHVDLTGRPGEVTIDCNVTPQPHTVFTYNAASPDALSRQDFVQWTDTIAPPSPTTTGTTTAAPERNSDTDIFLNLVINATPDATLRLLMDAATGDYITLNGEGTLRTSFHNKGTFQMFGTYNVNYGTYGITIQNILTKNFTFNPGGTIVFAGDPYEAALQLQAVYTVSGVSLADLNIGNSFTSNMIRVNCLMNISGQPQAPRVDFDLEMPTVNADEQQMIRSIINGQQEMNQQVIYLLSIGRFYTQGANNADQQAQGDQTSLAMQSLLSGALSTQINAVISQLLKNENWKIGANINTGNEGWHNAEYEGVINGRMLNNRLQINGQFGYRDNATQATPSFIGDFDLQYLLFPNGNLAVKVYNQTNDRYFTRSSLNTQGLGIVMKKDFNGLRDLFSTKKRKLKKAREKRK